MTKILGAFKRPVSRSDHYNPEKKGPQTSGASRLLALAFAVIGYSWLSTDCSSSGLARRSFRYLVQPLFEPRPPADRVARNLAKPPTLAGVETQGGIRAEAKAIAVRRNLRGKLSGT